MRSIFSLKGTYLRKLWNGLAFNGNMYYVFLINYKIEITFPFEASIRLLEVFYLGNSDGIGVRSSGRSNAPQDSPHFWMTLQSDALLAVL